jgi:hypothetical protein
MSARVRSRASIALDIVLLAMVGALVFVVLLAMVVG